MRGHRVRLATNGREALDMTDRGGFDLLLLDIHMPEVDGFQVVRVLREREQTAGGHLPVIALTARSREQDRRQCLAAGMDDYLSKPIHSRTSWRPSTGSSTPTERPRQPDRMPAIMPACSTRSSCWRFAAASGSCWTRWAETSSPMPHPCWPRPAPPLGSRCALITASRSQAPRYYHGIFHGGRSGGVRPRRPGRSRPARRGPAPGGTTRSDGRGTHRPGRRPVDREFARPRPEWRPS